MKCRYCEKNIYHNLQMCCFHGDEELSNYHQNTYLKIKESDNSDTRLLKLKKQEIHYLEKQE